LRRRYRQKEGERQREADRGRDRNRKHLNLMKRSCAVSRCRKPMAMSSSGPMLILTMRLKEKSIIRLLNCFARDLTLYLSDMHGLQLLGQEEMSA